MSDDARAKVNVPFDTLPIGAVFQESSIAPQLAIIPAGTCTMGAKEGELASPPDPWSSGKETQRQVTIAEPLAVGRFAVTRREFRAFVETMNYRMPDRAYCFDDDEYTGLRDARGWLNPGFAQDDSHPVVCVSWHDAMAYLHWLTALTGSHYRLLSEPEWEYACRSGSPAKYWCGNQISTDEANYQGYREPGGIWRKSTVPVKTFRPNRWGLWQMHGNVYEWCSDSWRSDWSVDSNRKADEIGLDGNDQNRRAVRGGSWHDPNISIRSAARTAEYADWRLSTVGFRVARTLEEPAALWRNVTSGNFAFWKSKWDAEGIPRLPGITFSGLRLYLDVYTNEFLPDEEDTEHSFNRAFSDLSADLATQVERCGFGQQRKYWVAAEDESGEYRLRKYYWIPQCDPETSIKWLYIILTQLSAARRVLERHNYVLPPKLVQWKVELGDKTVPWDESTRNFGFPT
jgi:formylglycine-generating enzyme required for sulfatase activity